MKIVCWQTIFMKYHTFFCQKLGKMSQNLSSAAVVIGALRVRQSNLGKSNCVPNNGLIKKNYFLDKAKEKMKLFLGNEFVAKVPGQGSIIVAGMEK